MHPRPLTLAGTAGAMILAGTATAGYTGLESVVHVGEGWVENGYQETGLITYRVYANFDGTGDDGVLSVWGITGFPMSVNSSNGMFHNDEGFDSLTAPQDLRGGGIWSNQWDTYVTIGATDAMGDATTLLPSPSEFATETNNLATNWTTEDASWSVTDGDEQSIAVEREPGVYSVLLGQFTVDDVDANTVFGTFNLTTREGENLFGERHPAPGALSLLGLAGLAETRRRRR